MIKKKKNDTRSKKKQEEVLVYFFVCVSSVHKIMLRNMNNRSLLLFVAGFSTAITLTTVYRLLTSPSTPAKTEDTSPTFPIAGTLKRKKVLFFGDSITQHGFNTQIHGWVSQFGNWWTRRIDILNRGYSGYNTRWAKEAIERVVISEQPDFIFLFFGANDAVDPSVLQHVSLNDYHENLRYMYVKRS